MLTIIHFLIDGGHWHPHISEITIENLCLRPRFFPLSGVSGPNSWLPEWFVMSNLRRDQQFLHVLSDVIQPSPSGSAS